MMKSMLFCDAACIVKAKGYQAPPSAIICFIDVCLFHRRVSFDVHATLTVIGVLLQPGLGSEIPCQLNCNNATLQDNLNGI